MGTTIPAEAEAQAGATARAGRTRGRTWVHRTGTVLIGLGVVLVAYAAVVWFWGDPITALYAEVRAAPARAVVRPRGASVADGAAGA